MSKPSAGALVMVAVTLLELPLASHAAEPLFHTRSYNAFTNVFGRPEFFAGSMAAAGASEARLTLNLVSFADIDRKRNAEAELDGETYHVVGTFNHVVRERWELGLRVPYLYHSGGFMDSTIDDFHDLFGFPEGDRPNQGQDELLFTFSELGVNRFTLDDSGGGIGDVQLSTRILLTPPRPERRQLALHGGVKLPTGDEDDLFGSGATDYSVGIGYSDPVSLAGLRTTLSAHAGVLFLGDGDVLEDLQEDTVAFGGAQLGFAAASWLTLIAQIQIADAYYSSEVDAVGSTTVQLAFGANMRFAQSGWDWTVGIVEDGLSKVMPDFALHMEISRRLGPR